MFAVQDDWIQYEAVPVRRTAVRGGAVCAERPPVVRVASSPSARAGAAPVRLAPEPRAPRRASLRLTRRGRVVLVLLPGLLAASAGIAALTGTPAAEAAVQPVAVRTVVVGTGESLWSVAERTAPDRDLRDVVAALQRENGLHGSLVRAGEVLRLPAGL